MKWRRMVAAGAIALVLTSMTPPASAASAQEVSVSQPYRGPRIMGLAPRLARRDDTLVLVLEARLAPDETQPHARITPEQVSVVVNDKTLKPSVYQLDATTGHFHLALDQRDLDELCGSSSPLQRAFRQGRERPGCTVRLSVTDGRGGHAQQELTLPPPNDWLAELLGAPARDGGSWESLVPGAAHLPGGQASPVGLRLVETRRPPASAPAQVELQRSPTGVVGLARRGETRQIVSLLAAAPALPEPPGGVTLLDCLYNQEAYFIGRKAGAQRGGYVVWSTHRRVDLPDSVLGEDRFWADAERVCVLQGDRLSAYSWDGRPLWNQSLLPHDTPGVMLNGLERGLTSAPDGSLLAVVAGQAYKQPVCISFIRAVHLAPDGSLLSASTLVEPTPAGFSAVEDVHPVWFKGRALVVASFSRTSGTEVATLLYDMAARHGRPLMSLASTESIGPWWCWGAQPDGDRLVIGQAGAGLAVLEATP